MTDSIKLPPPPDADSYTLLDCISYAKEAVRLNRCESRATTHAEGCWLWGRGHYECALAEIKRLEGKQ